MLRGERIDLLRSIAEALQPRDWYDVGLILDTFDIPDIPDWEGNPTSDYRARIREQPDELLLPLAEYLGVTPPPSAAASQAAVPAEPSEPDDHLWHAGQFRLFLSHITAHKAFVSEVKVALGVLGIDAFVAHEDIAPTREWVGEIEHALKTCTALAAFLHEGFHQSQWTDQEVGFAVARDVLVIPVRLGVDPYGFIGRYQGLSGQSNAVQTAVEIFRVLIKNPATATRMGESVVGMVESAASYDDARRMVGFAREYTHWTRTLIDRLENTVSANSQVRDAYGVASQVLQIVNTFRATVSAQ